MLKLILSHITAYFVLFAFLLPLPGPNGSLGQALAFALLTEAVVFVGAFAGYFTNRALRIDPKSQRITWLAISVMSVAGTLLLFFVFTAKISFLYVSLNLPQSTTLSILISTILWATYDIKRRASLWINR